MADHKRRGGQQQEKKDLTLDAGAVLEIIRTPSGNDDDEGLQIPLVIRETSLGLASQRLERFGMNLNSRSHKYR
jgi:hypothetical protein